MKIALILLAILTLGGCSSYGFHGKDPITGDASESVKMGFWDATTLILWGVPYDRFRLELRASGKKPETRWAVVIQCKNINEGPALTISCDDEERCYSGTLEDMATMRYDLTDADVRQIAQAKRVVVRIDHGARSDDATLQDGQVAALRHLYKKRGNTPLEK